MTEESSLSPPSMEMVLMLESNSMWSQPKILRIQKRFDHEKDAAGWRVCDIRNFLLSYCIYADWGVCLTQTWLHRQLFSSSDTTGREKTAEEQMRTLKDSGRLFATDVQLLRSYLCRPRPPWLKPVHISHSSEVNLYNLNLDGWTLTYGWIKKKDWKTTTDMSRWEIWFPLRGVSLWQHKCAKADDNWIDGGHAHPEKPEVVTQVHRATDLADRLRVIFYPES